LIKKLAPYIGEYKKQTVLTPLFVMLEVIMDIGIPLIMADLIDQGIEQGDMGVVLKYGVLLLAAALLLLACGEEQAARVANDVPARPAAAMNPRRVSFCPILPPPLVSPVAGRSAVSAAPRATSSERIIRAREIAC
jgi:ATP-binding cassette subfamily B protein